MREREKVSFLGRQQSECAYDQCPPGKARQKAAGQACVIHTTADGTEIERKKSSWLRNPLVFVRVHVSAHRREQTGHESQKPGRERVKEGSERPCMML